MYEKQHQAEWKYIVEDSGSKVVLAANNKIAEVAKEFKTVNHVVTIDGPADASLTFSNLQKQVQKKTIEWKRLSQEFE